MDKKIRWLEGNYLGDMQLVGAHYFELVKYWFGFLMNYLVTSIVHVLNIYLLDVLISYVSRRDKG